VTLAASSNDHGARRRAASLTARQKEEIVVGLLRPRKTIPCKYLYDERGSALFDRICELPEYYPTRTELAILRANMRDVLAPVASRARVVELGSGSGNKTDILLDTLGAPRQYVAVDIAEDALRATAERLRRRYPDLDVRSVVADYSGRFDLPQCDGVAATLVYFPGSTIGNLVPHEAQAFLARARGLMGDRGAMILGVDLKKDPAVLHAAYNDREGVTAAFNINLLRRMNGALDATFDEASFTHHACYEPTHGRIEMHLVSTRKQRVVVAGLEVAFDEGESICTEYSYKYTVDQVADLARAARLRVDATFTDARRWFGVFRLVAA
jgi:dimethylhistidine N-methyltransferase